MATAFPLFSNKRCPSEIQDLIWHHFILGTKPRVIEMKLHIDLTGPGDLWDHSFQSPTTIPTALKICSQSRHLAKRRWTLGLGVEGNKPKIWVDYTKDTLSFENDEAYFVNKLGRLPQPGLIELTAVPLDEQKKIRNVQLNFASLFNVMYRRDLRSRKGLEEDGVPENKVRGDFLLRNFPTLDVLKMDLGEVQCNQVHLYGIGAVDLLFVLMACFDNSGAKFETHTRMA